MVMTVDEAFKLVAENGNCSKIVDNLKSKRPTEQQLQYTLGSMVINGIRLDIAREALWLIEEWFDKAPLGTYE
jgi:hypothetical protein